MPSFQNWENDKLGKSKKTILFNISFFTEGLKTHKRKQFKILNNFKSLKYCNLGEEEGFLNGITWWWLWFRWTRACDSLRKQTTFQDTTLVLPQNGVWGTSVEIPYWRRVTTQIWVMLLIGWSNFSTNQKHYPDLGSDVSSVWISAVVPPQTSFRGVTSDGVVKCWLFSKLSVCEWDRTFSLWKKRSDKCSCAVDSHLADNNRISNKKEKWKT